MQAIRKRVGDKLVTVKMEEDDAIIDYRDIIAACRIVPDDKSDAPWDDSDGWEHESISRSQLLGQGADTANMRGAWHRRGNDTGIIVIDKEWARKNLDNGCEGMSKQARAERLAFSVRRMIDQLVKWYVDGWEYFGVVCEFKGHQSSCWGYDDYAYAEQEKREHADIVAHELEEEGYEIANRPVREKILSRARAQHDYRQSYMQSNYVR